MRFVHTEHKQALSFVAGFMLQLLLVLSKKETVFLKMFGKHVKGIRHGKSMSLSAVGRKCTLDNPKLSKIENGKINVTMSTIIQLAAGINVTVAELMRFEE